MTPPLYVCAVRFMLRDRQQLVYQGLLHSRENADRVFYATLASLTFALFASCCGTGSQSNKDSSVGGGLLSAPFRAHATQRIHSSRTLAERDCTNSGDNAQRRNAGRGSRR